MLKFIRQNINFAQIAGINLLSKLGDRLFYTAMLTIAATIPQNQIAVTIVSVSETLPIVFSFFLGSLADQQANKLRLLSHSSILRALLYSLIAILVSQHATLILLIMMASLNFCSDLLGNYSASLVIPFTKSLVRSPDLEQAQGLVSLTNQLVSVLATLLGSVLLIWWPPKVVAVLNAGIFLLVSFGYQVLQSTLEATASQMPKNEQTSTWTVTLQNFKLLKIQPHLWNTLSQLALLNGFFGGLTPIFVLFLKHNHNLLLVPRSIKIALLSGLTTCMMILGNSQSNKILINTAINKLAVIADCWLSLTAVGLLLNNIYLIFWSVANVAFLLGLISPRFSAQVIRVFPAARLGGIVTIANSLLVLAPPMTSLLFPALSNWSLTFSYWSFGIYGLIAIILGSRKFNQKAN